MKKVIIFLLLMVVGLNAPLLNALCSRADVDHVCQAMKNDFERKNMHNSHKVAVRMHNNFIERDNLTVLIARCEKDKDASAEIAHIASSGLEKTGIIVDCPCVAKYMLAAMNEIDKALSNDETINSREQLENSRERLERSWIKIMREGKFTRTDCVTARIK